VAGETEVCVADAGDATVARGCAGGVFGDEGCGCCGRGEGGSATRSAVIAFARASSRATLALQTELFETGPVALFASFLPGASAVGALGGFLTTGLPNLIQSLHVFLSTGFFFVGGFWEFDDRVYACTFAFAGDEPFVGVRGGAVGGESHDAAN